MLLTQSRPTFNFYKVVSIKVTFYKTITSQCKFFTDSKDFKSNKVVVSISVENIPPVKAQFLVEVQRTNKLMTIMSHS